MSAPHRDGHAEQHPAVRNRPEPATADTSAVTPTDTRYPDQSSGAPERGALPLPLPPRLLGEYELLSRLGAGGMGEVYRARHRRLDKLVALKLLPAKACHAEATARFEREMKVLGGLDHPNVVEAYDAGEHAGVIYLAMKLIDGVDLARLVTDCGPLPAAEACELARQAALGLHYLHERGLIHRDVKPSNLMRTADGTVKVLDLGLARWRATADGFTATGYPLGTPDFLAPEQARDAATADARADLYGLGGTLFYLLTGRGPFAHRTSLVEKVEAHRSETPPDVRTWRPDVPPALAQLVQRLLAKESKARPQTAAEVATALSALLAAVPPLPSTVSWNETDTPAPGNASQGTSTGSAETCSGPRTRTQRGLDVRRWLALVALLVVGILVPAALLWKPGQHPASNDRPATSHPAAPAEPMNVERMVIPLTRAGQTIPAGVIGEGISDPHEGDRVRVQVALTRPGYAFLIAFRPDGKADLCFPEKEDEPPSPSDKPSYPSVSRGDYYGLTDGIGLEAFAVVVSRQPLPAFKDWWAKCKDCPWKKEPAPSGVVYRANGEDPVEVLGPEDPRGKREQVPGASAIERLAGWLHQQPGIETVQVVGFSVAPKEKP